MELRSFRWEDVPEISKIWETHHSEDFGLPNRRSAVIDAVIEDHGKIIAYGQVKLFAEAMLFLDKSASLRARVTALRLLMLEAFRGAEQAGIQEIYAFITDPNYALLLQKHFKFYQADKPGELLIKEL
jgi:L-amino acid N-acyltransferase YncA